MTSPPRLGAVGHLSFIPVAKKAKNAPIFEAQRGSHLQMWPSSCVPQLELCYLLQSEVSASVTSTVLKRQRTVTPSPPAYRSCLSDEICASRLVPLWTPVSLIMVLGSFDGAYSAVSSSSRHRSSFMDGVHSWLKAPCMFANPSELPSPLLPHSLAWCTVSSLPSWSLLTVGPSAVLKVHLKVHLKGSHGLDTRARHPMSQGHGSSRCTPGVPFVSMYVSGDSGDHSTGRLTKTLQDLVKEWAHPNMASC